MKPLIIYFGMCIGISLLFFTVYNVYNYSYLCAELGNSQSAKCYPQHLVYNFMQDDTTALLDASDTAVHFNYSMERDIFYPWKEDTQCSHYSVRFATVHSFRPALLISYPGSGNTWLRYLIQGATGVFTGSIYEDYSLASQGFNGELTNWLDGSTILQKTHAISPEQHARDVPINDTRCIFLLRSPFEAIISQHNYMFSGHLGFASVMHFLRRDWETFVRVQVKYWLDTASQWLQAIPRKNMLVIHYEHMKEDPSKIILQVVRFLKVSVEKRRLECLQEHLQWQFFRPKQVFPPVVFSQRSLILIAKVIARLNEKLRSKGYPWIPYETYDKKWEERRTHRCSVNVTEEECYSQVDDLNSRIMIDSGINRLLPPKYFFMSNRMMINSLFRSLLKKMKEKKSTKS